MRRILVVFSLSLLFLILDNSFIPFISIKGYYPSLLFLFSICFSIISGPEDGLWVGIFTGALQDLYFSNGFGINILTNMLICVAAGFIGKGILKEKSIIPVLSCFALSITKGVLIFCILYLLKQQTHIQDSLYNSIYGMVISIIMYRKVFKLCKKNYMIKEWKF